MIHDLNSIDEKSVSSRTYDLDYLDEVMDNFKSVDMYK